MITLAQVESAVQNSFDSGIWFLAVLKHGGWTTNPDLTVRSIRVGNHRIQIWPRPRSGYYEIKIVDLANLSRYVADERVEVTASLTLLKNTIAYVLSKTTLLEPQADS